MGSSILSPGDIASKYNITLTGVIHVGAHEGQEVDEYIGLGLKKICLFEANEEHRDTLDALCQKHQQLSADFFAISDRNGFADFYITTESQSSSLLELHAEIYPNIKNEKKIVVETRTLDGLFDEQRLSEINMLHIDVQGAELLVLKGAKRVLKNIDMIITEINFEQLYKSCPTAEDIDIFLFDQGFIRVDTKTPYHPTWGDAAYVRSSFVKDMEFNFFDKRYSVSMSSLGSNGRFANQLFQYLFLVLYSLRSGCKPIAPEFPASDYLRHCLTCSKGGGATSESIGPAISGS